MSESVTDFSPSVVNTKPTEKPTKTQIFVEKVQNSVKSVEALSAALLFGSDIYRDMVDNPVSYDNFSITPEKVGPKPLSGFPDSWAFNHIGDIYETAALFVATRLSLTVADILLKKATKNKTSIPDEAGFWVSIAVSTLIPALFELNVKLPLLPSVNGYSDPEDLFGIGVAAVCLIASHYSKQTLEHIKNKIDKKKSDNNRTFDENV